MKCLFKVQDKVKLKNSKNRQTWCIIGIVRIGTKTRGYWRFILKNKTNNIISLDKNSSLKRAKIKCIKCKKEKALKYFYIVNKKTGQRRTDCNECNIKFNVERLRKRSDLRRKNQIKYDYNITIDDYNNKLINQNNKCAICFTPVSKLKIKLSVDHCHKTNKIRGLLCTKCNFGLGYFIDDIEILNKAIKYLEKYND